MSDPFPIVELKLVDGEGHALYVVRFEFTVWDSRRLEVLVTIHRLCSTSP